MLSTGLALFTCSRARSCSITSSVMYLSEGSWEPLSYVPYDIKLIPSPCFPVTVRLVVPPFCSTSSYMDCCRPSPSEIITTMEAVPITTPKTDRKVLSFRLLRLLMLILSKSLHLIHQFLLFCGSLVSLLLPDQHRRQDHADHDHRCHSQKDSRQG